jgi:hypothetical protein
MHSCPVRSRSLGLPRTRSLQGEAGLQNGKFFRARAACYCICSSSCHCDGHACCLLGLSSRFRGKLSCKRVKPLATAQINGTAWDCLRIQHGKHSWPLLYVQPTISCRKGTLQRQCTYTKLHKICFYTSRGAPSALFIARCLVRYLMLR